MKISSLKSYITPKTTGYTAAGGIVLTALSGFSKNKSLKKAHKPLAYVTAALTAVHIALVEYNYYQWKHKQL